MRTETTTPIPTITIGTMKQTGSSIPNPSTSTNPNKPISFSIVQNPESNPTTYTLSLAVYIDALYEGEITIQTDGSGLNFYAVSGFPSVNPPANVVEYCYVNNAYTSTQLVVKDAINAYNTYDSDNDSAEVTVTIDDSEPLTGTVQHGGGVDPEGK